MLTSRSVFLFWWNHHFSLTFKATICNFSRRCSIRLDFNPLCSTQPSFSLPPSFLLPCYTLHKYTGMHQTTRNRSNSFIDKKDETHLKTSRSEYFCTAELLNESKPIEGVGWAAKWLVTSNVKEWKYSPRVQVCQNCSTLIAKKRKIATAIIGSGLILNTDALFHCRVCKSVFKSNQFDLQKSIWVNNTTVRSQADHTWRLK